MTLDLQALGPMHVACKGQTSKNVDVNEGTQRRASSISIVVE